MCRAEDVALFVEWLSNRQEALGSVPRHGGTQAQWHISEIPVLRKRRQEDQIRNSKLS